jgi:hypothetical protein
MESHEPVTWVNILYLRYFESNQNIKSKAKRQNMQKERKDEYPYKSEQTRRTKTTINTESSCTRIEDTTLEV